MPGMITIRADTSSITRMGAQFRAMGKGAPLAIKRATAHTGAKAKTQMTRALTDQTGLKRKVIVKALKGRGVGLGYEIASRGGNISVKYFGARETGKGVTAKPWGKATMYAGAFTRGGRFPGRVPLKMGGHAFKRTGSGRKPIVKVKSGLYIPEEMVTGATLQAFNNTVATELPPRLVHELFRMLG